MKKVEGASRVRTGVDLVGKQREVKMGLKEEGLPEGTKVKLREDGEERLQARRVEEGEKLRAGKHGWSRGGGS